MTGAAPIRHSVTVGRTLDQAFQLFTDRMGTWWPLDQYSRAVNEFGAEGVTATELEFQARMGGSILEHLSNGTVLPWGEVIGWDPPDRVVMAWRPHSLPEAPTELEVTFTARGEGTLVEIEHRGWERLSPEFRATLYPIYVRGWVTTLERFAEVADQGADEA